jgi:hypothetical protein
MTNEQNKTEIINEDIIKYLDNEGDCERCGCNMCEEDWEHDTRELFVSNVNGKNICRRCVREEDELEDEETRLCEECGAEWDVEKMVETDDRKFYCRKCKAVAKCEQCDYHEQDGLGPLCEQCYEAKGK